MLGCHRLVARQSSVLGCHLPRSIYEPPRWIGKNGAELATVREAEQAGCRVVYKLKHNATALGRTLPPCYDS